MVELIENTLHRLGIQFKVIYGVAKLHKKIVRKAERKNSTLRAILNTSI